MRQPLIAGNWKLHKTGAEARAFWGEFRAAAGDPGTAEVWLFPSFTAIAPLSEAARGSWLHVGAQNLSRHDAGAFTGEVSAAQLVDAGATGTLVGHSERRHVFGESDDDVHAKVQLALAAGLRPIVCVGETLTERRAHQAETVVAGQVRAALNGVVLDGRPEVTVAYEPVWAIGTGETATPEIAQAMHAVVRDELQRVTRGGDSIRILYGGSVKPGNTAELAAQPDIDGVLVGGASLDPGDFAAILRAAAQH